MSGNASSSAVLRIVALVVLLCFSLACATSAKNVSAAYVSPLQFSNYTCEQLQLEYFRITNRAVELAGIQDKAASRDAVAMGVGLVIFWPALFFLAGSKGNPEELGRIRGEMNAIEVASIEKNCALAQQIAEERKKQAEIAKAEELKQNSSLEAKQDYGKP